MTESTEPMPEPLSEATAEDIAEQHTPVVPDDEASPDPREHAEADEADAWEQDQTVPDGEDEEDQPGAG